MSLQNRANATALRLILKFGKSITYTNVDQGTYDPSTQLSGTNETSIQIKGLISDYNRQTDGAAFVNGLVLEGDKKINIAAASISNIPQPSDKVAWDTFIMTVKNVKTTYAGDIPVLYEFHVRN